MRGVFEALGEPVRRLILELLAAGEQPVGPLVAALQSRMPISQPAVSQHLKVLRDNGLATVRPDGARRLYAVAHEPLRGIDAWLDQFRRSWTPHLDALATELARGKHERRNKPSSM